MAGAAAYRVDMDYISAGEVEDLSLEEETLGMPAPMRHRRVDEHAPERGEDEQRGELHALRGGASDQCRCDAAADERVNGG